MAEFRERIRCTCDEECSDEAIGLEAARLFDHLMTTITDEGPHCPIATMTAMEITVYTLCLLIAGHDEARARKLVRRHLEMTALHLDPFMESRRQYNAHLSEEIGHA